MQHSSSNNNDVRSYVYYTAEGKHENEGSGTEIPRELLNSALLSIGEELLKSNRDGMTREELEHIIDRMISKGAIPNDNSMDDKDRDKVSNLTRSMLAYLEQQGYIKKGRKMLTSKGLMSIGMLMLKDVIKTLKSNQLGMHETSKVGYGTTTLESSRRYEHGDDIRELNVTKTILNAVERISKGRGSVDIPIELKPEDLEQYEMNNDVSISVAYCIDLSSTMRYCAINESVSRIEAAKKALWCLYTLNVKLFPSDKVHLIGFGALATKIDAKDIPYLKTFEPGHDFLHYTNYQAAFRFAVKLLRNTNAARKRVVMITDGQPSACFVDSEAEKERILAARPYSHFYRPDRVTLQSLRCEQGIEADTSSGSLVYLCYRYRQVDPYIAAKTIMEAKKCKRMGIDVDTIMVSEEDTLLRFVNDMERGVKGRSYYINPVDLSRVVITDYLSNKKEIVRRS